MWDSLGVALQPGSARAESSISRRPNSRSEDEADDNIRLYRWNSFVISSRSMKDSVRLPSVAEDDNVECSLGLDEYRFAVWKEASRE